MIKLFSYGTLSDKSTQIKEFEQEFFVDDGTYQVFGYKLDKIKIGQNYYNIAVEDKSSSISGKMVHVPENKILEIDNYETSEYRRILTKTICGQECIIYVKNN